MTNAHGRGYPYVVMISSWRRLLALHVLVQGLLGPASLAGDAVWDERRVQAEVERRIGLASPEARAPMVCEVRMVRRSALSKSEVEARWAKVAPFPDHPDRPVLSWLRELCDSPEERVRTIWSSPPSWKVYQTGASRPMEAGGDDTQMWRLTTSPNGSAVDMVRAGVAYPSMIDPGAYKREWQEELIGFWYGLLGSWRGAQVSGVVVSGDQWECELKRGQTALVLQGKFVDGDLAVTRSRERDAGGKPGPDAEFAGHERSEAAGRVVAKQVTIRWPDHVVEERTLDGVKAGEARDIAAMSGAPAPPENVQIRDFTRADTADRQRYSGVDSLVWRYAAEGDVFVPGVRATPRADRPDAQGTRAGDAQGAGRQGGGMLSTALIASFAASFVAVVLAMVVMFVWIRRK